MQSATRIRHESGKISGGCLIAILITVVLVAVGIYFVVDAGLDWFNDQVKAEVKDNPVILEHIGTITDCTVNWTASGELDKEDHLVFDLVGSKGKGQLVVHMRKGAQDDIVESATLKMEGGEVFELPMEPAKPKELPPKSD